MARYPGLGRSECNVAAPPPARRWLDAPISSPSSSSSASAPVLYSVSWQCISCGEAHCGWWVAGQATGSHRASRGPAAHQPVPKPNVFGACHRSDCRLISERDAHIPMKSMNDQRPHVQQAILQQQFSHCLTGAVQARVIRGLRQ